MQLPVSLVLVSPSILLWRQITSPTSSHFHYITLDQYQDGREGLKYFHVPLVLWMIPIIILASYLDTIYSFVDRGRHHVMRARYWRNLSTLHTMICTEHLQALVYCTTESLLLPLVRQKGLLLNSIIGYPIPEHMYRNPFAALHSLSAVVNALFSFIK